MEPLKSNHKNERKLCNSELTRIILACMISKERAEIDIKAIQILNADIRDRALTNADIFDNLKRPLHEQKV